MFAFQNRYLMIRNMRGSVYERAIKFESFAGGTELVHCCSWI